MSQILKPIEDSLWYSKDPYNFRKLNLEIDRIETEKQIDQYSINTSMEIITDSEIGHNSFRTFFKVHYSISWSHTKYFDINRKTKKYEHYTENRLFNFASVKVYFQKENKSKIKAQIKRILDNEIKADMVFYEKHQTIEKPAYFDYSEKSDILEKKLEALN
jgi:hypothetical protein